MKNKADKVKTNKTPFPKSLLGFYFRYGFRPYWVLLSIWMVFTLIVIIANGVLFPLFQKWFIALFEKPVPAGMTFVQFAIPTIVMIVGAWIVIDILDVIRQAQGGRWRPTVQNRISEVLNDYLHQQSLTFWTNRMAGKINTQVNYVFGGFNTLWNFMLMFGAISIIIINAGLVISINHSVALVLGGVFAFRLIYSLVLMKPMNKASKTASDSSSHLSGKIIDSLSNYSIVKLFAGAKQEKKHLEPPRQKNVRDRIKSSYIQRFFWAVPGFVWDISFGLTMLMCVKFYVSGEMKISDIVFTVSVYFSVMGAIANIVNQIPDMVDVIGSAQKSYEELVKPIEIQDAPNAPDLKVSHGKIEIRGLVFKYKRNAPKADDEENGKKKKVKKAPRGTAPKIVLDDLNLVIKPGEKVGIVGSSGAGKSTLVNLLMRFYDPTRGEILIDGQNIREVKQDSLRENIAFIPQEPTMFNRTLRENIGYGRPDATDAEIRRAAKRASADEFIMETEKKYESLVGDRGIKLSGGQRQRIAIARAFLKNAPILILDEATAALDSETEAAIQKSFEELSAGRTTIAIAHRLSTLRNMDRIIVIDHGKIVESGTHMQLLRRRGGIYARLWKMQSGGFLQE